MPVKIHPKVKEWFFRYAPGELCGIIGAQIFSFLGIFFSWNRWVAAFTGTFWDSFWLYAFMTIREVIYDRRKWKKYWIMWILKTLRNLIAEFGVAEVVDVFIIRPFCMYLFPLLIPNFQVGIFVGWMVANITFYGMAIMWYEIRKIFFK